MSLHAELEVARAAVRQAATACRAVRGALTGSHHEKRDRSPVTVADYAAQAVVCRALEAAFPADLVMAEETAEALRDADRVGLLGRVVEHVIAATGAADVTGDQVFGWIDRGGLDLYRPRFWALDPIDGTIGFLAGRQYAVALALLVDGEVELGVLGCPELDEGLLIWALRGEGAWSEPLAGGAPRRLAVSATDVAARARMVESHVASHGSPARNAALVERLGIAAPPLRVDSQVKYAMVARGDCDLYVRAPRARYREKVWDHAAGLRICLEAGGRATDIRGAALDFTRGSRLVGNAGVVVSNGALHELVLAALR